MRVGVAGAGRIGEVHIRTLLRHPDVAEVVVFDPDANRVAAPLAADGATFAADVDSLLGAVDAIVIASPTPTHAGLLDRAVAAGLPAFCEKPVAAGLRELHELAERIDDRSGRVQVGFHYRFDPGLRELGASVRSRGPRRSMRVNSTTEFAPSAGYLATAGGLIADKLIHELDMVRWITGAEVATVAAMGSGEDSSSAESTSAGLLLQLTDGGVVMIWGAYRSCAGFDLTVEVETPDAIHVVGNRRPVADGDAAMTDVPSSSITDFRERFAAAYEAEMAAFLDFARGTDPNPCDVHEAVRTHSVVVAAETAMREQRVIEVGGHGES